MSDVDTGQVPDNAKNGPQDGPENNENDISNTASAEVTTDVPETTPDGNNAESAEDTIRKLRKENAERRTKAKAAEERADALAKRLHTALISATGKLADPDALAFDAEHLDDAEKLTAAIDALIEAKPYLKARKVIGDAGQGPRGGSDAGVNLLAMLPGNG